MEKLFNNKYRIPPARLQNWDYANEAMYFVPICTKNRENYFGEIVAADDGRDVMHRVYCIGGDAMHRVSIGNRTLRRQ